MAEASNRLQLSVVVPAYNDARLLTHTLRHIATQTVDASIYEILVVDDGSTDETPAVISAAAVESPVVRSVRLDRNRGRAAARNAGVRAARGPLIVFIDSDVLVPAEFLAAHLSIHAGARQPVVGRGPVVLVPTPMMPERPPMIRTSPAYLDTANASIPRTILLDAGLFDEGFRLYGWEDFDLGMRLQARGLPRVFSPEAIAFHVQPPTTAEAFDRQLLKEEERARTALYLLRKHPGTRTRMLIQDTTLHRAVHFVLGGAGLLTVDNAPRIARWLASRGLDALAYLALRGVLNRHYLRSLNRFRALAEGS
jgi:glycosyltransferase involved in cell wall biosynthesis